MICMLQEHQERRAVAASALGPARAGREVEGHSGRAVPALHAIITYRPPPSIVGSFIDSW